MQEHVRYLENMADRLRIHSIRMTAEAGSGHPTSCLSAAEIMSTLFFHELRFDPENLGSPGNDEFILSKGHAAPILYAALAEAGSIPVSQLTSLRNFDSPLEGHPVPRLAGIKAAAGSLGQGLSFGLGMALAMKLDSLDSRVYVLLGDGEMAEGNVWEAMNFASYVKMNNICAIVDVNRLGQSGPTMFGWEIEEYRSRAEAFGWKALSIDGHSVEELIGAFSEARENPWNKPVVILAKTVKGKAGGGVENENGRHGKPLPEDSTENVIGKLEERIGRRKLSGTVTPANFIRAEKITSEKQDIRFSIQPGYKPGDFEATRTAFGNALSSLGEQDTDIVVLDGDVKNSTRTKFFFGQYPERSFECYIAEQNMIGMAVGLQARGKRVFTSTFAAFITRAHDQFRMAAYSDADIRIAGSHTGVSIGEDGPSQMGLEDFGMMRPLLYSTVLSPCDAVSAEKLTAAAAENNGITYIRTIRSKTPVIYAENEDFHVGGSKVLKRSNADKATIAATGITVHESLKAADKLEQQGIPVRVIDCYSVKPLDKESLGRAAEDTGMVITVEDHYPEGGFGEAAGAALSRYFSRKTDGKTVPRYVLISLAVTQRPHSGNPNMLLKEQGIDAEGIIRAVKAGISKAG